MTSTHQPPALNGVEVPKLFATLDTVKAQPAAAKFQFRARNEWIGGTHNRTTIQGFYGAGMEDGTRTRWPTHRPGSTCGRRVFVRCSG
jgi:hypothetical protein